MRTIGLFLTLSVSLASTTTGQSLHAPYALSQHTLNDTIQLLWYYPGVNARTYSNDGGEPNNYYLISTQDIGARVMVEFDDLIQGSPIESISLFIWGEDPFPNLPGDSHSSFRLALYDHQGTDTAETALWGPYTLFLEDPPAEGKWATYDAGGLLTNSTKLCAEFTWLKIAPTAPLPALDYMTGDYHTSYGYRNGSHIEWHREYGGNLLLRLSYNLPDTLADCRTPANLPDSFGIFISADSLDRVDNLTPSYIIKDSMHIKLPAAELTGSHVSVAAYLGNKASNPSNSILIDIATDVIDIPPSLPANHTLSQNHPNPFNSTTVIISDSPNPITILDILGREVVTLHPPKTARSTNFTFTWNGHDKSGVPSESGIYFYKQEGKSSTKKMILLK